MADTIAESTQTTTATETPVAPAAPAPRPGIGDTIRELREKGATAVLEERRAAAEAPKPGADAPEVKDDQKPEGEAEAGADDGAEGDPEGELEGAPEGAAGEGAEAGAGGDDAEAGEEEAPAEDGKPFVLKLPGRGANDADLEIPLDGLSKAEQDAFNRMRKGYLRGEQLKAEQAKLTTRETRVEAIETALKTDPAAFVLREVTDRATRTQIALDSLVELLDDSSDEAKSAYESFIEQLQQLEEDPVRRENHKLKREKARQAPPQNDDSTGPDPEVRKVVDTVRGMVPAGADQATAAAFVEDALRAIYRELVRTNADQIAPEEVRKIASRYQAAHGLKGPSRPGKKAEAHAETEDASAPAAPEAPRVRRADPKDTGKKLAEASQRRRAAASTPAGGGAPPVSAPVLPKGAGIKDALASLRQNLRGG